MEKVIKYIKENKELIAINEREHLTSIVYRTDCFSNIDIQCYEIDLGKSIGYGVSVKDGRLEVILTISK